MRVEEVLITQMTDLSIELKALTAFVCGSPEWFSLRKASEYKGIPYNTVKTDKYRQPKFGIADKMDGTKKYWSRKTVVEWAQVVNDNDLLVYRKKYKIEFQSI